MSDLIVLALATEDEAKLRRALELEGVAAAARERATTENDAWCQPGLKLTL